MIINFEEKGRGRRKRSHITVKESTKHKDVNHLKIHLVHPQRQKTRICGNLL